MIRFPKRPKTQCNNASFHDRLKAVATNFLFSQTVVVQVRKGRYDYISPDIGQNQSISSSKAVRLKTFLNGFYFESVNFNLFHADALRQIGNAVSIFFPLRITMPIKRDLGV